MGALELPQSSGLADHSRARVGVGGVVPSRSARSAATLAPVRRLRSCLRVPLVIACLTLALGGGCKNRNKDGTLSELAPPKDAEPWRSNLAIAFDDSYTPTSINLQGRAPNDVRDQQLFQARLGHAAIVVLVKVDQIWGKGRYQGRQEQYLEVELGETLMGTLPKDAPERLMLQVDSIDELPGTLRGEIMLLFLAWDSESEPPFHHHLMPANDDVVALINAMVKHAQQEGVLDAKGDEKKSKRRRRGRRGRKNKRGKKRKGEGPDEPVDEGGADPGSGSAGEAMDTPLESPTGSGPEAPPPAEGPQPDASTGLQDLGGDPEPPADEGAADESPEGP